MPALSLRPSGKESTDQDACKLAASFQGLMPPALLQELTIHLGASAAAFVDAAQAAGAAAGNHNNAAAPQATLHSLMQHMSPAMLQALQQLQ